MEPSGNAVGFWERPEESLDRAAALGCSSFRLGVEWARVCPDDGRVDAAALASYVAVVRGCLDRGLEPLVTLHHFTHPAWLGDDLWLRPDAPERYRGWVEVAVEALAPWVRWWVTVNEINVLAIGSWLLGMFPPGRSLAFEDAAIATDHLLTAHVRGYEAIHRARPDAVVTTNNSCMSAYAYDRLLTDVLLARSAGVDRSQVDAWLAERAREHDALVPPSGVLERMVRRLGAATAPYGRRRPRSWRGAHDRIGRVHRRLPVPRRAVDAVYDSPHERTLDVLALDWYDPTVSRHFRLPGHRTAGGRNPLPTRELWDDVPDPAALTGWLEAQRDLAPGLPLWVVENGLCNRVLEGRPLDRLDGWDRPRYLREHLSAVMAAVDRGVPVTGLLALVVGRQLRVGVVPAPLRPLRDRPSPGRARAALAGHRRARGRLGRGLPPPHRRPAGRRSQRPVERLSRRRPSAPFSQPPGAPSWRSTCSACCTIWATMLAAGINVWMAPTPCPVG